MMTSWELAQHSPDKMFVNGVCSDTVGLYVDRPPMPPMAAEKVSQFELPAQNGISYKREGYYDDVDLTVKCFVFDGGYNPQDIYKFLSAAKTVTFSRAPDYFYKVKKVRGITPQYKQLGKNFLQVVFTCEAFRYTVDNAPVNYTDSEFTVYNRGNVDCEPVYKLTISDEAILDFFYVNGEWLKIQSAAVIGKDIYIDVPRKKVYYIEDGIMTVCQRLTVGRFWNMTLRQGWNTISRTEDILAVEIVRNERWI